jgi:molybdenum cofactor cytidylyltransferase
LMADLNDNPLGLHIGQTLAAMGFGWRILVSRKGTALTAQYSALGFTICANDTPETGQAHSLHLAVHAAMATKATALLVVLADMPFVTQSHLVSLLNGYDLAASFDGLQALPPALFPRAMWPNLLALTGDQGARLLLKNARLIAAPASQLRDIDTPADLSASN